MMNGWLIAAVWMGLALIAGLVSIRLGISVALVENIVGIIGGNFLHPYLVVTDWINFLAGFGSVLLTFLAGAEIEPDTMKRHWREVVGVYPLTFVFKMDRRVAKYTTAMMSTGLTFGTISALYGINHHYIDQR